MKFLLKKAYIVDSGSPHHHTQKDILIEDGLISAIEDQVDADDCLQISEEGLAVSPGWVDVFADCADPGYEFRETLESAAAAAAAGGFTSIFALPNTRPVVDSKSQVEYIVQKSKSLPVDIVPLGAITRRAEGKELAEMYDMNKSGARAFSDGISPLQTSGILLKALQYVKAFAGVIVQVPEDASIAPNGLMHEGLVSTRLGLPGKPMMAEELIVARDIKLARYADSKIHFTGISSPKSLEYINRARESGLSVSCSVTPYHLAFCDEDLYSYNTNLKVNPPLRSRADMMALRQAVLNGTIDCLASHHSPQDWDHKTCEFEYATPGMIGLQTAYSALKTFVPGISVERTVELLSTKPRSIFALEQPSIKVGELATLTLFQPEQSYRFTKEQVKSKSYNTPFTETLFTGKVTGIVNRGRLVLNTL